MNRLSLKSVFLLVLLAIAFQLFGQTVPSASLGTVQERLENESDIELQLDILVSPLESLSQLVIQLAHSGSEEIKTLHRLPINKDSKGYYLEVDNQVGQRIYNNQIRYFTSFHKVEIQSGTRLMFYVVDNSGAQSDPISYLVNP